MNNTSGDPAALLASRKWRIRHSAWLLAPILGIGLLSFVGFAYIGLRARTRKFWIALVVGGVGSAIVWVVTSDSNAAVDGSQVSDWGTGVSLAVWAGLIVYGVLINRDYLRWRAGHSGGNAWYRQPVPSPRPGAPLAPPPQGFPAIDRPRAQPGPVDANSTPAAEMAAALRIDPDLAGRIVAVRQARGGFRDLDDLVAAAGLQPHEMVKLNGRVTFGPVQAGPRPEAPQHGELGGRILDF